MIKVILCLSAGIAAGRILRKWKVLRFCPAAVTVVVCLLLFLLGAEIGSNEGVTGNLLSIGSQALVFAFAGVAGSVLAAALLWRLVFKRKEPNGGSEK